MIPALLGDTPGHHFGFGYVFVRSGTTFPHTRLLPRTVGIRAVCVLVSVLGHGLVGAPTTIPCLRRAECVSCVQVSLGPTTKIAGADGGRGGLRPLSLSADPAIVGVPVAAGCWGAGPLMSSARHRRPRRDPDGRPDDRDGRPLLHGHGSNQARGRDRGASPTSTPRARASRVSARPLRDHLRSERVAASTTSSIFSSAELRPTSSSVRWTPVPPAH